MAAIKNIELSRSLENEYLRVSVKTLKNISLFFSVPCDCLKHLI